MKKRLGMILATALLLVVMSVSLVACANPDKLIELEAQTDIIKELKAKTADIGIIDSVMAEHYVGLEVNNDLQIIEGLTLKDEQYGIGFRKGSKGMIDKVNVELAKLSANGKMAELTAKYGISDALIDVNYTSVWDTLTDADKADYETIKAKGKVKVGYTVFEPVAYPDKNNELIGYDIELAKAVFGELGLQVEFQKIVWDNKANELRGSTIDCVWNGMTISEDLLEGMDISAPYLKNKQVAIIRKADNAKYTKDIATFKGAFIVAENESAGEKAYNSVIKPILEKM